MLTFRKILGVVILLVGVFGLAVSFAGYRAGGQLIASVSETTLTSLDLVYESLEQSEDSLALAKSAVDDLGSGLKTLAETTDDLSQTLDDTQPLIDEVMQITSEDVPDSLESMQATLPDVAQVAAIIDDTLGTLSDFKIEQRILGIPIAFDLGIDYNPDLPFDESVNQISDSMVDLPDSLRGLKDQADVTAKNMDILSQDITTISLRLTELNDRVNEVTPLLDEYIDIIDRLKLLVNDVRGDVDSQLASLNQIVLLMSIWFGLSQIAPLYVGWELMKGRRLR